MVGRRKKNNKKKWWVWKQYRNVYKRLTFPVLVENKKYACVEHSQELGLANQHQNQSI